MRHADPRRAATAVIAKAASALSYDTAVWYLVWVRGCVLCLQKNEIPTILVGFRGPVIQSKFSHKAL